MTDARAIIEKADVELQDLLDGGKLNPTQQDRFYQEVIEQPTILNEIRTVQMPADKYQIDKIGFGTRMWRAAPVEGAPLKSEDRYSPSFDQVELNAKQIIAEIRIPYSVLEDSIEQGTLEDTFMSMASRRTSADFQELVVKGDTASDDPYLSLVDGALQLPDHTVDEAAFTEVGKELWRDAQQALPSKYLRDLDSMRFYMSPNNLINYRYTLAGMNADVGYDYYTGRPMIRGFGVPIERVSDMPDSNLLFADPSNIIMGIHRDVMIETERSIRTRELVIVMTARVDVKMENSDAAVVVNSLNV